MSEQRPAHLSEWAALQAIATKLGTTAETLRKWVWQAERDAGRRLGLTTSERARQVVSLAARGRASKIIAYELGLAHSTVRALMARAAAKLEALAVAS